MSGGNDLIWRIDFTIADLTRRREEIIAATRERMDAPRPPRMRWRAHRAWKAWWHWTEQERDEFERLGRAIDVLERCKEYAPSVPVISA